jgi:hypothetical protein
VPPGPVQDRVRWPQRRDLTIRTRGVGFRGEGTIGGVEVLLEPGVTTNVRERCGTIDLHSFHLSLGVGWGGGDNRLE